MSKETYRQCEMVQTTQVGFRRYVAWLPTEKVRIKGYVTIDGIPGRWQILSAGEPRERATVDTMARVKFPDLPRKRKD